MNVIMNVKPDEHATRDAIMLAFENDTCVLLSQLALTAWLRMAAMVRMLHVCLNETLSGWLNYPCSCCLTRLASLCCASNASFGSDAGSREIRQETQKAKRLDSF